jgi:hypothetical protein
MNNTIKLTKSTKAVLRYYLDLNQERFCLSLEAIADASLGRPSNGKPKIRTVQRANECLRQRGLLSWVTGHGPGNNGFPAKPNEYRLNPMALRIYKRKQRAAREAVSEDIGDHQGRIQTQGSNQTQAQIQ